MVEFERKKVYKRVLWLNGALLVASLAFQGAVRQAREPDLLGSAVYVTDVSGWADPYSYNWISDRLLIGAAADFNAATHLPSAYRRISSVDRMPIRPFLLDTATGEARLLHASIGTVDHSDETIDYDTPPDCPRFCFSPTGEWVTCIAQAGTALWGYSSARETSTAVARQIQDRQGREIHGASVNVAGGTMMLFGWPADSRYIVRSDADVLTCIDTSNGRSTPLEAGPTQDIYPSADMARGVSRALVVTPDGSVVEAHTSPNTTDKGNNANIAVRRWRSAQTPGTAERTFIPVTPDAAVTAIAISRGGKHICWAEQQDQHPSWRDRLTEFAGAPQTNAAIDLWVGTTDGADRRRVGTFYRPLASSGFNNPNGTVRLGLRWLPSGNRVSLVFGNLLYVLPVGRSRE